MRGVLIRTALEYVHCVFRENSADFGPQREKKTVNSGNYGRVI